MGKNARKRAARRKPEFMPAAGPNYRLACREGTRIPASIDWSWDKQTERNTK